MGVHGFSISLADAVSTELVLNSAILAFHSSCLGAAYFGRAWPLINLYSTLIKFCSIPCPNFPPNKLLEAFQYSGAAFLLHYFCSFSNASSGQNGDRLHGRAFTASVPLTPQPFSSLRNRTRRLNLRACRNNLEAIVETVVGIVFSSECVWGARGEALGEAKRPGCSDCFLSLSLLHCCTIGASQCCSQCSPTAGLLFSFPASQLWLFLHPSHHRSRLLWPLLQQLLVSHAHVLTSHTGLCGASFHSSPGKTWRTGSEAGRWGSWEECRHTSGQAQLEAGRSRGMEKRLQPLLQGCASRLGKDGTGTWEGQRRLKRPVPGRVREDWSGLFLSTRCSKPHEHPKEMNTARNRSLGNGESLSSLQSLHVLACPFRGIWAHTGGEKGSAASGGRSSTYPNSLPWRGWCGASHGGDGGLQLVAFSAAACHWPSSPSPGKGDAAWLGLT